MTPKPTHLQGTVTSKSITASREPERARRLLIASRSWVRRSKAFPSKLRRQVSGGRCETCNRDASDKSGSTGPEHAERRKKPTATRSWPCMKAAVELLKGAIIGARQRQTEDHSDALDFGLNRGAITEPEEALIDQGFKAGAAFSQLIVLKRHQDRSWLR